MTLELTNNNELTEIRILKEASCPSLSERTTLTYHIGCNERNEILFRIYKNEDATGKFNSEWFSSGDMLEIIHERKSPFRGKVLSSLVEGKSVNTAYFLLAALMHEGLLQPLDRLYEQKSSAKFQDRMKGLMASTKKKAKTKKPRKPAGKATKPVKTTSEKGAES